MSPAIYERKHAHPDAARVIAISAAISLNAGLLLLAMRPLAPHLRKVWTPAPLQVRILPRKIPVSSAPLPPVIMPERPQPAITHAAPHPVSVLTPTPVSIAVTPGVEHPLTLPVQSVPTTTTTAPDTSPAPVQANLAYRSAPAPRYPTAARRAGMQGTVLLRVLVDTQGHPQEVQIATSSGYPLLDRSARLQVLRHWQFQPAQVDGRRVPAWATVPVQFQLDRN